MPCNDDGRDIEFMSHLLIFTHPRWAFNPQDKSQFLDEDDVAQVYDLINCKEILTYI